MDNDSKYLPIGSICNINNYNKPIMIIGYYSVAYNGSVKMYDYQGCEYPEGMLLYNKQISFNHNDIVNVIFKGYENDNYVNFNNLLNKQNVDAENKNESKSLFNNIKFDENGVVIYDGTVDPEIEEHENKFSLNADKKEEIDDGINNPFYEKYEEKNIANDSNKDWPIFKKIEFDENGIVISAEEN